MAGMLSPEDLPWLFHVPAELWPWIKTLHIYVVIVWIGALCTLSWLLRHHTKASAQARVELLDLEKRMALTADLMALLTVATGVSWVLVVPGMHLQVWLYPKLGLVGVLLILHLIQRLRVRRAKRDSLDSEPVWMLPALMAAIGAILAFAVAKPV